MMDESKTERKETGDEMELSSKPTFPSECLEGENGGPALGSPLLNHQGETRLKTLIRDIPIRWSFRKYTLKSVKEHSASVKLDETREANVKTECPQTEFPAKCRDGEGDRYFRKDSPPMDNQEENEPQTFHRGQETMLSFGKGTYSKEKPAEETGLSRALSKRFSMIIFKGREDGQQTSKETASIPEENKKSGREEDVKKEPLSGTKLMMKMKLMKLTCFLVVLAFLDLKTGYWPGGSLLTTPKQSHGTELSSGTFGKIIGNWCQMKLSRYVPGMGLFVAGMILMEWSLLEWFVRLAGLLYLLIYYIYISLH